MYYVYILYDKKRFYIGLTSDLNRRLSEHEYGSVSSTKNRKDLELVFYEAFRVKSDAEKRERYFKTTKGKRTLRLMLEEELNN